ncbi:MAG TPA: DUF6662 family protein [Chthoniobacterales bacterium]|jgi:hypothetical protein|nr:DUF6662 family protein [Chthoniobacterales bacterium]
MEQRRTTSTSLVAACIGAALLWGTSSAEGGARRFTYVYEATTAAPGSFEFETWGTWKTSPREERRFNALDFRHEIEFGIMDHLQAAIYLADWGYLEDPGANEHGFSYQDSALELIYNLTNPTTDLLGSALYGEIRGGPEELELESKIILQKNIGRFVIAYNGTLEAKWEGDRLEERRGELAQSLGASYEISPAFLLGAELLHEIDIPDWSEAEDSVLYAGPNLSYRHGNWWATLTPLAQLTNVASEVDFQTRLIFGFSF